jgi:YD repeat-containing protein
LEEKRSDNEPFALNRAVTDPQPDLALPQPTRQPPASLGPRSSLPRAPLDTAVHQCVILSSLQSPVSSLQSPVSFVSEAYAADVQYVYDDLGRLSAVVNATSNEAAIYQYDAVGNLLGITRQPASTLTILNFTPKSGLVGTSVTIAGLGFSPTATQNTVTFNGMPTTVSSATATQLVVTVPTGATTGTIAVTTPSGLATSSSPFTVTSGGSTTAAPTITNFTPTVGAPGTPVTITGSNFATPAGDNRVLFHTAQAVTNTAAPTSLTTSVPTVATSGPIAVTTPAGQGMSAADFFVPPAPYTASAVAVATRLTFGQSQPVTLSTANTIALLLINGTAGHRIGVNITNVTLSSSTVSITNPYGQVVASATVTTAGAFVESPLLLLSGTYTISVIPVGTATGGMTVTPHDIVDLTGTITSGSVTTMNLTNPGQQARFMFTVTAGQRASVQVANSTFSNCANERFFFREPDSTPWIEVGVFLGFPEYTTIGGTLCPNIFMDAKVFQQAGTYQLVIDPTAMTTGQITLTLQVFNDVTVPVSFGTATTVTTTMPGQNAKLTFAGTVGQRVLVHINTAAVTGGYSITNPDGTNLVGSSMSTGAYLDTRVLPQTGTYTVLLDPTGIAVGAVTLTVYNVPADVTGTITPGTARTTTIPTPGQAARLTFAGTAGQRASVRVTSTTISSGSVFIVKPDGTSLAGIAIATGYLDAITLPVTGTYAVVVDPASIHTGQATMTLYVFADVTGTLTINGAAVTVTTTMPGQRGLLALAGTANQLVTIRLTGNTMGGVSIVLRRPDGTVMVSTGSNGTSFNMPQQTLAVAGTYTVEVDPNNPLPINTGSLTVAVTSP